jgi:hypothetical protein
MKQIWITVDNIRIDYNDVSHQHWSNIYWYHKLFQKLKGMYPIAMNYITVVALSELDKRFYGEILPYKPVYAYEVTWLDNLNMLRGNNIMLDGKKVGEVLPDEVRYVEFFA